METATLAHIRRELKTLQPQEIQELCSRLARFKKENKELLNYLLFEAHNEDHYIAMVKADVSQAFSTINVTGIYLAKKTIRKALRIVDKHARFSGKSETEVELRIHFCHELQQCGISIARSKVLTNLYDRQVVKIQKAVSKLHPDLQFDFEERVKDLT